ncbi:hypothetical protein [Tepidiforma sp.]|uniref:hypothetical protein n=1 Tax=Tepidiforma sp. TaxID=2682230 RepID=UPI002ADDABE3|nr:hypothetical protein [Tepidiforma sp.]
MRSLARAIALLALACGAAGLLQPAAPAHAAATRTWTGLGPTANFSDAANWDSGIPAPGDTLIFPASAAQFAPVNDLPPGPYAAIRVTGGSYTFSGAPLDLAGDLVIESAGTTEVALALGGPGGISQSAGELRLAAPGTFTGPVTVSSGTLRPLDPAALGAPAAGTNILPGGALRLAPGIDLGSEPITISGSGPGESGALQLSGGIAAIGPLAIVAEATVRIAFGLLSVSDLSGPASSRLTLTGGGRLAVAAATFAGTLDVRAGTLQWDANSPAAAAVGPQGELAGTGTLASLSLQGGRISPGSAVQPGTLTVTGPATLHGGSLRVALDGVLPTSVARLRAGTLAINGTVLELQPFAPPDPGQQLTIVEVAAGSVSGTFAGLPEGAVFALAGRAVQITYRGGDGNDIALRVLRILEADLAAAITVEPTAYRPGTTLTARLTMTNAGPDAAVSPRFTFGIPAGLSFVSVEAPGHTCITPPHHPASVTCYGPTLPAGESRTIAVSLRAAADLAGPLQLHAGAFSATADAHTVNNTASVRLEPSAGTLPYRRILPGLAADAAQPVQPGG